MTVLYQSFFDEPFSEQERNALMAGMPDTITDRMRKFVRWQDSSAFLVSRYLLQLALHDFAIDENLDQLKLSRYGRPFIDDRIDFNISHTDNFVACIASDATIVGVDVEKIKSIDIACFKKHFENEWSTISSDPKPLDCFYKYWTLKEAIAKANGKGMHLPFNKIRITSATGFLDGTLYHVRSETPRNGYTMATASESPIGELTLKIISV
jgi:4'-phosphopantetheinyl transferase